MSGLFSPTFNLLFTLWFHCGKRSADIIEKLNESIHRFVFNDLINSYEKLLQEINQLSLRERRINDMLILVFLALNNAAPSYNNNNFIYIAKIDQLNSNIKTAGINLCAVDKIFQFSVSNKKRLLETKR